MYDLVKLEERTLAFEEYEDKLRERSLPPGTLELFHRAVLDVARQSKFIVKGSRAAQALLPVTIYTPEELKYSDYDLISARPFEDLVAIGERMIELGMEPGWLDVRNTIFKTDVFRLSILRTPLADSEKIPDKIYATIPYEERDGVRYLSPAYWKIDLYSILSRPVYINIKSWKKTLRRLASIEEHVPYSRRQVKPARPDRLAELELILEKIRATGKECLPAGLYAYRKLLGAKIPVPYLELLTTDYKGLVRELGRLLRERPKEFPPYLHMIGRGAVFGKAVVYEINMCTGYSSKGEVKYASPYYQLFYFNFLKYARTGAPGLYAEEPAYYDWLMSRMRLRKLPVLQCVGDQNPGAREFIEYMQKGRDKKVVHKFEGTERAE